MEKNHQMKSQIRKTLITAAAICSLLNPTAHACTGIRLIAEDGTVIHARTMEFAIDIHSDVIMVPRGYARTGTTPDGKEGLKWKAKYASVGANGVGLPVLFDGLNEKGLAAGTFYFPTSAGYMTYTAADAGKTIAQWEVGSWILENFASVEEVKANIGNIVVPAVVFGGWGFAPEAHYIVHDAAGKSIVIEYVGGKLNVYDNPLGVITNSPSSGCQRIRPPVVQFWQSRHFLSHNIAQSCTSKNRTCECYDVRAGTPRSLRSGALPCPDFRLDAWRHYLRKSAPSRKVARDTSGKIINCVH